jgi:hypothetical protein
MSYLLQSMCQIARVERFRVGGGQRLQLTIIMGILASLSTLIGASSVNAEEFLQKGDAKYLGWQTSKAKFTTCASKVIDIENGTVEKTQEKCKRPPGPAPASMVGTITRIDLPSRAIAITKGGKERNLYYPEIAERPGRRLEELKVGEWVTVSVPMAAVGEIGARAESLDIYEGEKK